MFEYLEDEEDKKKRAKMSEDKGESMLSASSSGPAVAQETVPRSRGGVPMSADSGDSVPETVKRNIRDSEQGESKNQKTRKTRQERKKEEQREAWTSGRSLPLD